MDRHRVLLWVTGFACLTLRASQAKTLAWIITGMLKTRQCNLAEIAEKSLATTSLKHQIKRLSRFLGNDRIDPVAAYSPWLIKLLKRKKRLVLALDWTQFRSLHTLALVGVFGGRAVPLLWRTVHQSGLYQSQSQIERELLTELRRLLPQKAKVVILADRGFGKTDLAKHCQKLGLDYLIRIKTGVHIRCQTYCGLLSKYPVRVGQCHVLRQVKFRKSTPVVHQLVVNCTRTETFYLMTSLHSSASRLLALYRKRMSIEEMFRDQKSHSHGFSLRSTRVTDPSRFDRLLLVLAIGYLLLCGLGLKAKSTSPPSYWCSNRRPDEVSVLTIARRMLDRMQLLPNQAFKSLTEALEKASPNWG